MENKKVFGEYILAKRKEIGLTQREFADKLYVTESAVSKWERGISYPDITLIRDICEILGVSEHELLTSSEDVQMRNYEKLAAKLTKMKRSARIAQYIIYGVGLLVCFICNLAIDHKLSWFFIVLTSEMVAASLTLLPSLLETKRGLITLASFTGSLLLLLLVCNIYTHGNWFLVAAVSVVFGMCVVFLPFVLQSIYLPAKLENHKTLLCFFVDTLLLILLLFVANIYIGEGKFMSEYLPVALVSLTLPWAIMLVIRYIRFNNFFKTSICLALSGAYVYALNDVLSYILDGGHLKLGYQFDFSNWSGDMVNNNINAIVILSILGLAVVFAIVGAIYSATRKEN